MLCYGLLRFARNDGEGVKMSKKPPTPRFTVITLGVSDMRASIAFYEALGFARKMQATGEAVAFFDTGGTVIGLFPWDQLARDATLPDQPRPKTFRGSTLAWNCGSVEEVDAVLDFAISCGASLLKPAHRTDYGGYSGYFSDPDDHPWEVVVAPGIEVGDDRRVHLPD
jgi:catechol 2,3-dioxygenase-like lactoylglutathione lyase family enzyme